MWFIRNRHTRHKTIPPDWTHVHQIMTSIVYNCCSLEWRPHFSAAGDVFFFPKTELGNAPQISQKHVTKSGVSIPCFCQKASGMHGSLCHSCFDSYWIPPAGLLRENCVEQTTDSTVPAAVPSTTENMEHCLSQGAMTSHWTLNSRGCIKMQQWKDY